jgi:fructose-1,6-bisphosphatase/inositol monophosphatase family enzyme
VTTPPIDALEAFDAAWSARLLDLAARVRRAVRRAQAQALARGSAGDLARPHGRGAGDTTFGIDVPAEAAVDAWFEEAARAGPLSLLTEDRGWRHAGPDGRGGARALDGWAHGGPRIVVDPIDGTRNLMAELRPAWTVIAACPPGAAAPRQRDVALGVLAEIPDSRAAVARVLWAARGRGARRRDVHVPGARELGAHALDAHGLGERVLAESAVRADGDARCDQGYFPFFRYAPDLRPAIARIEADFFARLAQHEGADPTTCWDDQYISNGGQLALLALGTYRMVADLRAFCADRRGAPTQTGKPYDVAGAILVAREAGCALARPDGGALDFPLDAVTPVGFVAWHNTATERRLGPHLAAVLG